MDVSTLSKNDEIRAVFEHIATGLWLHPGNTESISGPGSTVSYTVNLRKGLARFLADANCRSILDAPCGDFNWMRHVELTQGTRYFGADIVSTIVQTNQSQYGSHDRFFLTLNVIEDPLPDADVWICRDCLFHFSFAHAIATLRNGLRSRFRYYVLTSHVNADNYDIETGGFRELNLRAEPFGLPEPLGKIVDFVEGFPPRYVGIWSRDQVLGALFSR